tara:strand:+ start:2346 stop:3701 length:1356 start_codon:yes stop_codon:yes gene_type:complete
MIDDLLILLGRFHPLIIHLPIGFIALGVLIEMNKNNLKWSKEALQFIFFWASISGVFSIITGYFQYQKEGYLWETIQGHLIAGILTVILSFTFYLYLKRNLVFKSIKTRFFTFGHILLLTITGHLGGNITHGEDHLTEPFNNLVGISSSIEENSIKYYDDFAEKPVFKSLIQPLLNDKCVKCHNDKKSKGGLKMHTIESLKQGGKSGYVLNFENPELSEILIRIHLPEEEKKHMPPSSGKQFSREEINILSEWINQGSSFSQKLNEFNIDDNLVNYFFTTEMPFYPESDLPLPNNDIIKTIQSKNILILPINKGSNLFSISMINSPDFRDQDLSIFNQIKDNIVNLDLSNSKVTDSIFSDLKTYSNLTVLKLSNTKIKGNSIGQLSLLPNLKRLYLVNSSFQEKFIEDLIKFKNLESVFLFQENTPFKSLSKIPTDKLSVFNFGNYKLEDL